MSKEAQPCFRRAHEADALDWIFVSEVLVAAMRAVSVAFVAAGAGLSISQALHRAPITSRTKPEMLLIPAEDAVAFSLPGLAVLGLAAPSRGSREICAWRVRLAPGTPGARHSVDREEIFVALAGRALAVFEEERVEVKAGDTLVVTPHQVFSLGNPGGEPFEALAVARVGIRARAADGQFFPPPWTQ